MEKLKWVRSYEIVGEERFEYEFENMFLSISVLFFRIVLFRVNKRGIGWRRKRVNKFVGK